MSDESRAWLAEAEAAMVAVLREGPQPHYVDFYRAMYGLGRDERSRLVPPRDLAARHEAALLVTHRAFMVLSGELRDWGHDSLRFWESVYEWLELTPWHDEVDFRIVPGPRSVEIVWVPPLVIEGVTMESAVAQALTALRGTGRSITVDRGDGVYFQLASFEDDQLLAETVSDEFLKPGQQLGEDGAEGLLQLGFSRPNDDTPNWWIFIPDGADDAIAAAGAAVAESMRSVDGASVLLGEEQRLVRRVLSELQDLAG